MASAHDSLCEQLLALVADRPRTWRLEVAPSGLSGAGDGVHLRGHCEAGTALTLYPGVVFAAEDLPSMHKMILPGNEYVLARRDGALIDGRPDGPSQQLWNMAAARDAAAGRCAPRLEGSHLAIGNKVNHPPAGTAPNVYVHPLDLREGEHPALHEWVPTLHFRPPAAGEAVKQTAVFVAARELRDEELLLDYKLRPQGPLEPWYAPTVAASSDEGRGAAGPAAADPVHPHASGEAGSGASIAREGGP